MFGILLALASAACFGLNNAMVRRGVLHATVLQGMAITVPLGIPLFFVIVLATGGFGAMVDWSGETWAWMASAGVVHFVVGRYGNYRAIQALGATLSTPIQQVSIVVALALGLLFLDEVLNGVKLVGIVLVVAGPVLASRGRKRGKTGKERAFTPETGPGLFWGAVSALGYGASPLMVALALRESQGMVNATAGLLVSYLAATLVVAGLVVINGGPRYLVGMGREGSKWFVVSALFVAVSQLFRYMALAVAPVTVVVPVQRLSVLFRLLFNVMINREHEVIDGRVILSIALSVLGAVALAADTGFLLDVLSPPESWRTLLTLPIGLS
jgi:drug/metabolite transporter (DMT)-like permease